MIAVLDDHVIDQIAAGEVIERPASAVKELVENAFDAGAEAVQVELEEGGLERITVSDDGRGMSAEDARACIHRHATSKLKTVEDLAAIQSYGFRGEALSSIGSVSELTIATRRAEDRVGTRLEIAGGELRAVESYGGPAGTTVDVRGLFYNTPARRKFMRSPATEQAHVVEAALRVALGARRGGVIVNAGTRRLLDIPEDQSEAERVKAALGPRVNDLVPVHHDSGHGVLVSGYVTPLDVLRNDTKGTWFFVNGRFVRERSLQRALVEVFRAQVPPGRYPMAVIYIEVDPETVDVNVHPQKLEVRFSDSAAVYRALTAGLTELFVRGAFTQAQIFERPNRAAAATERFFSRVEDAPGAKAPGGTGGSAAYRPPPLQPELPVRGPARAETRRWVLRERDDSVVIIDRLAVARRLAEEALRDELAGGQTVAAQELLLPEVFEPERGEASRIDALSDALVRFGLEIGAAGPERYALRSVPRALAAAKPARVLERVRGVLSEIEAPIGAGHAARLLEALLDAVPIPEHGANAELERAVRSGGSGVYELRDDELRERLRR